MDCRYKEATFNALWPFFVPLLAPLSNMNTTLAQQTTGKPASSNTSDPLSTFSFSSRFAASASSTNTSQTSQSVGMATNTAPKTTPLFAGLSLNGTPAAAPAPLSVKVESAQKLFQGVLSSPTKQFNNWNGSTDKEEKGKSAGPPTKKTLGAIPHQDFTFEDGSITFQAGYMTFTLHLSRLMALSPVFKDMFSLGPAGSTSEGTKDHPVVLQLDPIDFERFLRVIYPLRFDELPFKTAVEWYSVLLVADLFNFVECGIRGLAITQIEKIATSSQKIAWGEKFQIKSLLTQGFNEICNRSESLTCKELMCINYQTLELIMKKREELLYASSRCGRCPRSRAQASEEELAVHFKEQLRIAN